uniref:Bulb-type lectin domain-containing protein n=1 Tax=Quercus lobata TaxID=97700 RepID=A0A7N2MBP2_QUELO
MTFVLLTTKPKQQELLKLDDQQPHRHCASNNKVNSTLLLCSFHVCCADRVSLSSGDKRYVGIWYTSHKQIVVWVANRDSPLINTTTGAFGFTTDGNLTVLDMSSGKVHWCDPCTTTDRIVNLTDSGNLALYNNETTLWESFKNPTDTFLPNMTMDVNSKLTSWRDRDDPGTGNFTFMLDTVGNPNTQTVNKEGMIYWKSLQDGAYYSIVSTTEGQNRRGFGNARWVHQKFDVLWRHLLKLNDDEYMGKTRTKELVNLQEEYVHGYNVSIRVAISDIGTVLTGRF